MHPGCELTDGRPLSQNAATFLSFFLLIFHMSFFIIFHFVYRSVAFLADLRFNAGIVLILAYSFTMLGARSACVAVVKITQ